MEAFLIVLVAGGVWMLRAAEQRQRIARLAALLAPYRIERHLQALTEGCLRALGEADADRAAAIWGTLQPTGAALREDITRFADDVARLPPDGLRVSRLPIHLPGASGVPALCFDLRGAVAVHARGIRAALDALEALPPDTRRRDAAFTLVAELLLLQHTCQWFCRSRLIASARLQALHQTAYAQVVAGVSVATRTDYRALIAG
ncbi:hypothetical protein [Ramlibacter sp.]|uniref:hypothetical protein n=1 Tax=Ramlibacter sp. TaxID=1917967 RepID=UPI0035B1C8BD